MPNLLIKVKELCDLSEEQLYDNDDITEPVFGDWIIYSLPGEDMKFYGDIVKWIYDNIDDCEKNVNWVHMSSSHVKFKKKEDAMLFKLVFGEHIFWSSDNV